jgi:capsular exopolysaccharide synthesis family protein
VEPVSDIPQDVLAGEPFPDEPGTDPAADAPLAVQPVNGSTADSMPPIVPPTHESEQLFRRFDFNLAEKLVVDRRMMAVSREQYRRLAAILHDAQASRGIRVAMVASAMAGEGKTLTAANLALTLSESYHKRVLLIDADLRRPALDRVFKINASSGLADGLDPAGPQPKLVVRQVLPNLAVLPAGSPVRDPMARLISDRMRNLVNEAKESFDWVILDAPPLMLLPDAHLLASMVDAAVLVIKAASTQHRLVQRAMEAIGRQRILGVVLNQTADAPAGAYDQSYTYTSNAMAPTTKR